LDDDMKRDELRDFRMFLKNGGYEQNPTMGGNIIKVFPGTLLELRTAWNGVVFFLKTLLTVHFSRQWE